MKTDCLQHCLTSEESAAFNEQGYLAVENAVEPATLARLIAAVDQIDAAERDVENGADKRVGPVPTGHRQYIGIWPVGTGPTET
ncbi:hypothetical protein GC176_14380 [bacterium]|nr:hypothetical protein [bacterium]